MISALCHSADNAHTFDFNATPWFREAEPRNIGRVAEGGWSSRHPWKAVPGTKDSTSWSAMRPGCRLSR